MRLLEYQLKSGWLTVYADLLAQVVTGRAFFSLGPAFAFTVGSQGKTRCGFLLAKRIAANATLWLI